MRGELICWDSSVLIDWIKGDIAPQNRFLSVKSVVGEVERGTYRLVVSTLVYPEVLETSMSKEAIEKFCGFMQNRKEVEIFAVDIRVAKKAQEIRNCSSIKTPDAVHIATAIVSRAKLFHTFDKDLLKLDKKEEVDGLAITACDILGLSLPLF